MSPDAVLLTTLRSEHPYRDGDVAQRLIQAVVADLVRRGVRALEAFGIRGEPPAKAMSDRTVGSMRLMERIGAPARESRSAGCSPETCMIEADFLEDVGFEVVAAHHRFPRLRLELNSDHGWKEDVERARPVAGRRFVERGDPRRGALTPDRPMRPCRYVIGRGALYSGSLVRP